jgi:hypothetical protein
MNEVDRCHGKEARMFSRMIVLIALLLSSSFVAADTHVHANVFGTPADHARADLMVGIMLQSQCDANGAERAYRDALSHTPRSKDALLAIAFLPVWLKAEAIRNVAYARATGFLHYYAAALRCDPENEMIFLEYSYVLRLRSGSGAEQATESPMQRPQF